MCSYNVCVKNNFKGNEFFLRIAVKDKNDPSTYELWLKQVDQKGFPTYQDHHAFLVSAWSCPSKVFLCFGIYHALFSCLFNQMKNKVERENYLKVIFLLSLISDMISIFSLCLLAFVFIPLNKTGAPPTAVLLWFGSRSYSNSMVYILAVIFVIEARIFYFVSTLVLLDEASY